MESLIHKLFILQWQRKAVALFSAILIWVFVSHSITSTKIIPFVPIRVINLPTDKTIQGLQPNGFLGRRTTLTLTGTKDVIDQLEPGDVEIILDVSNLSNDGIVRISKKNLISLNPNINLSKYVTEVNYPEFVVKISSVLTEKIPIIIYPPIDSPPDGYEFLDIWPMHLTQTVSGPQEDVLSLKNEGLEITFSLGDITKEQLNALHGSGLYSDEVNFPVPESWKKVNVSFLSRGLEKINDPEAKNLQITFLRQEMLPIKNEVPIHVFYPLKYSETINPDTYALNPSPFIRLYHQIPILTVPLFAYNVSQQFVEVVRESLEIDIVAALPSRREYLEWGISFIDDTYLENRYVALLMSHSKLPDTTNSKSGERENYFRNRFRLYKTRFALYIAPQYKLKIQSKLEDGKIIFYIPNASLIHSKPPG